MSIPQPSAFLPLNGSWKGPSINGLPGALRMPKSMMPTLVLASCGIRFNTITREARLAQEGRKWFPISWSVSWSFALIFRHTKGCAFICNGFAPRTGVLPSHSTLHSFSHLISRVSRLVTVPDWSYFHCGSSWIPPCHTLHHTSLMLPVFKSTWGVSLQLAR